MDLSMKPRPEVSEEDREIIDMARMICVMMTGPGNTSWINSDVSVEHRIGPFDGKQFEFDLTIRCRGAWCAPPSASQMLVERTIRDDPDLAHDIMRLGAPRRYLDLARRALADAEREPENICGACSCLSVTEKEQDRALRETGERPPHRCKRYEVFLTHGTEENHRAGRLMMCGDCIEAERGAYDA
jgi:hypothetical protein